MVLGFTLLLDTGVRLGATRFAWKRGLGWHHGLGKNGYVGRQGGLRWGRGVGDFVFLYLKLFFSFHK